MKLIIDDRERAIIPHIGNVDPHEIVIERLTVGDYAFVFEQSVLMIIERKSLNDLAASIKDGRMDNNDKLLEAQQTSGCQIMYIIEGTHPGLNMEKKWNGMPFKCLQGKLDNMMFKYDLHILWTKNETETAFRLMGMLRKIDQLHSKNLMRRVNPITITTNEDEDEVLPATAPTAPTGSPQPSPSTSPYEAVIKKPPPPFDMYRTRRKMLSCFDGISLPTSQVLLDEFPFVAILLGEVAPDKLANVKYGRKRIGKRGVKLHGSCVALDHNGELCERILTCIPGVSKTCAKNILSETSFRDILTQQHVLSQRVNKPIKNKMKQIFSPDSSSEALSEEAV